MDRYHRGNARSILQRRAAIFALVTVAESRLALEIDAVKCAMEITDLRSDVEDPDRELFLPFIGVASEADNAVVGDRTLWAPPFLEECDRRYRDLEEHYGSWIDEACAKLIAEYRPKLCSCPACGFVASAPPYSADGTPSYSECPCCAFAFDAALELVGDTEFSRWRRRWIRAGMPFRESPAPSDYDPQEQLQIAQFEAGAV